MKKRGELDDIEAAWPEKKNDDKGDEDEVGEEEKEEIGKEEDEKEESGSNDQTELWIIPNRIRYHNRDASTIRCWQFSVTTL